MKHATLLLALLGCAELLISGCAHSVPFVHQMRADYELGPDQLKQIQYYVSGQITLRRELTDQETSVTSGHELKVINDKRIEEVVVLPGTPGIAVDSNSDFIRISFEEGGHLNFGSNPDHRDRNGGKYFLGAKWQPRHGGLARGELKYQDKTYEVIIHGGEVYLLVDMKKVSSFKKESRVVGGRKLD